MKPVLKSWFLVEIWLYKQTLIFSPVFFREENSCQIVIKLLKRLNRRKGMTCESEYLNMNRAVGTRRAEGQLPSYILAEI